MNETTPEHPVPWRIGRKLADSYLGPVTLYDGEPDGDGNQPGRFIGVMFSSELAARVVEAVNARQRAERLEGALQAAREYADLPDGVPLIAGSEGQMQQLAVEKAAATRRLREALALLDAVDSR